MGPGACRYKEVSSTPTYGGALSLGKRMHIRVKARTRPQPRRPSHLRAHSWCMPPLPCRYPRMSYNLA